ncbi:transforming growth factor beta regulator 1 [Contarinia nasturtii]|uniref:transforming growth factor beta regulator 1 n=1 Tax=Contarinia nasturtii TaxID=265458 RepID=UPI0012D48147|nr:transforming growth factor beta regulator 1 [Contarinia nasturtii]
MAIYSTIQQQNAINMKYKKKLKKLKKFIENLVFENAALCDQVSQVQESIVSVKEERRFLLKRLMDKDSDLAKELSKKQSNDSGTATQSTRKPYKKRAKKQQATQPSDIVSLDSNDASSFPIDLGALKILSIGQIIYDRPHYHTENWIYPSGFISTRSYAHIKDKDEKGLYTCRITENGDFPRFEIIPEWDPQAIMHGPTADLCHALLIQNINENTGQNSELQPQGEWFFGLTHSTVTNILQNSVDIKKCTKFKGFNENAHSIDQNTGHSVNYGAFEKDIAISNYHTVLEVKEEPPDELF